MKKIFILACIFLCINSYADIDGGITIGGNIGLGMPYEAMSFDTTLDAGASDVGWTIRPAIILGSQKKFAIGIEYTYKYQKYTLGKYKWRDVTRDYPWTGYDGTVQHSYYTWPEEYYEQTSYTAHSHNIGISFTEKLTKNPNWWTFGYDTDSKGPFFSVNIGIYHGPDDTDANFMLAINTYISSKKIGLGIALNFQAYSDYYSKPVYNTPVYTSYSPSTYISDTSYYNSYYTPDTSSYAYYSGGDRVYVRGHYRHYKSGKVSYVRAHTRSYPGRGRGRK